MSFTPDALDRNNRMWWKLGGFFEERAFKLADSKDRDERLTALDEAATAEGCFWRATGDADAIDLKKRTGK